MSKAWYVGLCGDWRKAQANLRDQGYLVRVPKRFVRVHDGKKSHAKAMPRFDGYILIACEEDELGPISNTRGMKSMPGYGALVGGLTPYKLPAGYTEMLERLQDEELEDAIATTKRAPRTDLIPFEELEINIPGDLYHGKRCIYVSSYRGVATVFLGFMKKEVEEADLQKIEPMERKAA